MCFIGRCAHGPSKPELVNTRRKDLLTWLGVTGIAIGGHLDKYVRVFVRFDVFELVSCPVVL